MLPVRSTKQQIPAVRDPVVRRIWFASFASALLIVLTALDPAVLPRSVWKAWVSLFQQPACNSPGTAAARRRPECRDARIDTTVEALPCTAGTAEAQSPCVADMAEARRRARSLWSRTVAARGRYGGNRRRRTPLLRRRVVRRPPALAGVGVVGPMAWALASGWLHRICLGLRIGKVR